MLWRLPAPVRCLTYSAHRRYGVTSNAPAAPEPLRILFCGSDNFSIASLRALQAVKRNQPALIETIDVVHRPAKRTGRGLKRFTAVPITHVATEELKLNTHVIDTFTGWAPPVPINLVVAVSFGLFVPPRILGLAKYGGLNVHPSLLPDLRGPAPIEHALLKHRPRTGVSIQTLHPEHFDEGAVLAQTAEPWTQIPHDITRLALEEQLASAGAHMLVDVLKAQQYIPPHKDAGWYASSGGPVEHAPKITKQDRFIDFAQTSLDEILTIQRALGEPWCILPNGDRLILHQVTEASTTLWAAPEQADADDQQPGIFLSKDFTKPLFRAACGALGIIETSTYAGSNSGGGNAKLMRIFSTQEGEEVSAP